MKNSTWAFIVLSILAIVYLTWPDQCNQCQSKEKEINYLHKEICKANSDTSHKHCLRISTKK